LLATHGVDCRTRPMCALGSAAVKQTKMPADPNRRAKVTVDAIDAILDRWPDSEPPAKDPGRVERGKVSGAKGGKARAAKLSPAERSEIARRAAQERWHPAKD
jgi:hypothetical protein